MRAGDILGQRFEERLWRGPVVLGAEINDAGLVFGAGTVLARMTRDQDGTSALALDQDKERVLALLSAVYGRSVSVDVLRHIEGASEHWRRGDKALANIRLAFARLPRLDGRADAYRLFLAEELLDKGLSPRALLKELGFDQTARDVVKYDPNQSRVPAGSGGNSGQWTSNGAGPQGAEPVRSVAIAMPAVTAVGTAGESGTLASGLFTAGSGGEFLAGLAALGNIVGVGATLGVIFVPSPNSVTSEGEVRGDPNLRYSLNDDEGVLRLLHQSDAGTEVAAVAQRGRDGIFFEIETGMPIARYVSDRLVFDAASLASESAEPRTQVGAEAGAQPNEDTPQLCPDPGPDVPHGASARAIAYQAQISALNNPARPLPPGLAVSLYDPITGKRVVYDDCRESDGTMIEAKGPGFARLLRYSYFANEVLPARWEKQARKQVAASGWRNVDWFFAEKAAADLAREVFEDTKEPIEKLTVRYEPAMVE